jgi:hypothetical protein
MGKPLRVAVPGRKAEVVAEVKQLNGYDGARFTLPDDFDIGRGKQPADALRTGYFDNPGAGRDQNAVRLGGHTYMRGDEAGVV